MSAFKTSRTFDAAPETVFAAFADPQRLARWWGPDGFRNTFDVFEFQTGGLWNFTMHGPDGKDYFNESRFNLVEPNHQIIIQHVSQPHFQLTITLTSQGTGTHVGWEQAFESAEVAAAVKHIVEPSNEQNLNRWQAVVAENSSFA